MHSTYKDNLSQLSHTVQFKIDHAMHTSGIAPQKGITNPALTATYANPWWPQFN